MGALIHMNMGTVRMSNEGALLTLTQWMSPSYPTGAFAWSHGLETACFDDWVHDAETLENWLQDSMRSGSGWTDSVLIVQAYHATSTQAVIDIDRLARALSPSSERLREAERQGQAFAKVTRDIWAVDIPDLLLPVALGRAAGTQDIPLEIVTSLYLQSFVSNLVSAAQRLMPLGQTQAQRVIKNLASVCQQVAVRTQGATISEIYSNTFLSDIASMRHETQEPRLFQS